VGRDGVLGFAFSNDGQPGLASGAGVLRHFLGGGSGEDLAAFGLAVTSVVSTSAHFGQAMAGTTATAGVAAAFRSFSIWRTFGEAAMPSSPTGLYWALAVLAKPRAARATAARAIFGERFVFIFGTFFQAVSLFGELFSFDTLNTPAGGKSL
jgi:hypothetical protein